MHHKNNSSVEQKQSLLTSQGVQDGRDQMEEENTDAKKVVRSGEDG